MLYQQIQTPQVCKACPYLHRVLSSHIDSFTGIGVRIAVYIQAFLPLVPLILQICTGRPLIEFQLQAVQSASSSLFTGMALIISAIIQQHTQDLSVFHALMVLNLCWITVFGCLVPFYVLSLTDDTGNARMIKIKSSRMLLLFTAKLMFMGGFGVWVLSRLSTFDSTPNSCTSSTVFWILGRRHHVTSWSFRTPLIVKIGRAHV